MNKRVCIQSFFLAFFLLVSVCSQAQLLTDIAQSEGLVTDEVKQRILERLKLARPELEFSDLRPSPMLGVSEIKVNGQAAFVSSDGSYLIAGEMYEVKRGGLVNLQEQERQRAEQAFAPQRAKMLGQIKTEDMVIYSPEKDVKGFVYVFTDIDCGFCRRLHSQMKGFMDKGIEIRYLAFPRAGPNSASAKKLATTWCASDPRHLMDRFKRGANVALADCEKAPILEHYILGQKIGVRGTPAIVTSSGQMIPGAVSPDYLAEAIGI